MAVVSQFNTNDDIVSQPTMKIQSINIWFNPVVKDYLYELIMLSQVLNDSFLTHTLTTSLTIQMTWLSLAASTVL